MDYDMLDPTGEMGDPFSDKFEPDSLDIHDIIGTAPRILKREPSQESAEQLSQSQQSASSGNRHLSSGSDNMEFDTDSDAQSRTKNSDEEPPTVPVSNHIFKTEIDLNEYMELEKNLKENANNFYQQPPLHEYVEKRRLVSRRYRPGLDCIMSDHNYSNQLDDSQDGYAPIDANDLTLSELLERVQDKLCEGSPVYDVRLELLSLVASLANDKVEMSKNFMSSIDDKLKLIKLSMEASSQSSEVSAPDTVEMVPNTQPEMVDTNVQTDDIIIETKDLSLWDDSPHLEDNVKICMKRLQVFSDDLPNTSAQLVTDLRNENNDEKHLSVISNYIGSLETGFREIVKEFKVAANLPVDENQTERSPSTSAHQQNQKSKERWLTHSSSDEDEHQETKIKTKSPIHVSIIDETIQTNEPLEQMIDDDDFDKSDATDKELLDAVESIESKAISAESTLDDHQRTLSCDYMEKLVYDTDSNDETQNDLYESFDNYQPPESQDEPNDEANNEPIVERNNEPIDELIEEPHTDVTEDINSSTTGYAEVSGMSDEEFLGFAEDIVFDNATSKTEIKETEDEKKTTTIEPENGVNSNIKEEESLEMDATQSMCSEDEHEGLDNLLNANSDKDFEFDGEFFLDSVCDEPTAERLLEAAQTFEDDNVVNQIEEDHEQDQSEIVLKNELVVEKQSEEIQIQPEVSTETAPIASEQDEVVDNELEPEAEVESPPIDYLHDDDYSEEQYTLNSELEPEPDIETPAKVSVPKENQDELETSVISVQQTEAIDNVPESDNETQFFASAQEDDETEQDDNEHVKMEHLDNEVLENEQTHIEPVAIEQVETEKMEKAQDKTEHMGMGLVESDLVETDHLKMEHVESELVERKHLKQEPEKLEQVNKDEEQPEVVVQTENNSNVVEAVEQKLEDVPAFHIEDSSSHESVFMMPVEVQMDVQEDDSTQHLSGEENGIADDDDEGEEGNTEREIERLLDFSNLNVRKRAHDGTYYVPLKKPEPTKQSKPVADSLIDDIAQAANDCSTPTEANIEHPSDSMSDPEDDVLTEEQYLHQCNMTTKEKLLQMLSSDSEGEQMSGSENTISGVESEAIDDEEADENSRDSAIEVFLKKKVDEEMNTLLNVSENKTNGVAVEENGLHEKKVDQKTKKTVEASVPVDEPPKENSSESTDSSGDEDIIAPTKFLTKQEKHIMGKNIFSGLDDFLAADTPEPVIDLNEIDAISERSSLSSDCELLDTSMFKSSKDNKEIDDKKLSRLMKNSRRAAVAKAAQPADDCISLSSDTDLELDEDVVEVPDDVADDSPKDGSQGDKNRAPRRMLRADQLADATKSAQTEEKERVKRLEKKADRLAQLTADSKKADDDENAPTKPKLDESDVVLDYDSKEKCRITVHPDIVKHLKPHQVDGVKFMYDSCYGSVDDKHAGSGCILAHCMGLGKTLQLIALLHTLIRHTQLKTNKILVICPKSTVMNWAEEIERWLGPVRGGPSVKVFQFPDSSDINEKLKVLKSWQNSGRSGYAKAGCLLIGYEAFRTLVFYHLTKKRKLTMAKDQLDAIKRKVEETLLKPGADIVICDEGHMIKNRKSATSLAVNEIKTRKRIILTGTPIQNNLKEYYSMVNFIKPSFLGTEKEFANLYANPIRVGQHKDSSKGEIKFMKQRSYVLHKKLSKFVQRREAALLKTFLPEKYEYVLFIPMTDVQNRLYVHFLENNPLKDKYGGKSLIPDYTFLRKIWTHPKVLESAYKNALILMRKKESKVREKRNVDSEDEQPDDVLDSQQGSMSVTSDWWKRFVTADDLESLLPSNKLRTLFEILQMCQENGEKCLVFSAFVAVLDVVEYFMKQINNQTDTVRVPGLERYSGPWVMTKDYYRLDGKTPKSIRHAMITRFNDPSNSRTRCFLISAKAGGQGINLIGANRVVLLDTSWNPSNDQQNIFRVFRLGQKSKCYIYRLLAMGTMEEKVYSRSVTKQAMSFRVVDEQQIDRHYSMAELAELYTLTIPDYNERPTPIRPYDNVLANLLHNYSDLVYKYHEHDSLLERNSEQDLSEEEKADAWAAYEKDVSLKNQYGNMPLLPGADSMFHQQNPYGGLNMAYPQMGNFGQYGYPNSAAMMNSFLSSMSPYGTTAAMEKEIALLSQMYNSPYANLLATTARGGPSSTPYPYSSPYSSGILPQMSSSTGGPPPYTPTTTGSVSGSNFAMNPYNPSNQHQNLMANMNNYLPQFNKSPNALPPLPANMPGPSTSTPAPSYRPLHQTSALRDIDKDVWSYLTSASNMYAKDDLLGGGNATGPMNFSSGASVAPGPNAMKNPLLFKELTIPCAEPVPSGSSGHILPSIPTSVITSVGSSKESPKPPTTPQSQVAKPNQIQSNTMPIMTTSTGATSASSVTVTGAVNKDLVRTVASSANQNRRSPLTTKSPASLLSPTQGPSSPAVISLTSTTTGGPQTSPEPHIIVKNVNAINQSIKSVSTAMNKTPSQPQTATKPPTQPVKNFNMGIVYPANKKTTAKPFELNDNNTILRAAKAQLNALTATKGLNISNTTNIKGTLPTIATSNLGTNQSTPVSSVNLPNKNNRVFARSAVANTSPVAGASKVVRRPLGSDPPPGPKLNEARTTIDPKRWTTQGGLTISPVTTTSPMTFKATPMKTTTQATTTPGKANIYTMAAQNLLKNNTTKPSPVSVTPMRQPTKTNPAISSTPNSTAMLVRQNTAPTFTTGQTRFNNVIQSTNNGTTIIRQPVQQKGRPVPPLVRQNTTPMISTTTQPAGQANIKTLTNPSQPTPGTSNTPTIMNRNVTVRRVNQTAAAPGKATVVTTNAQFTPTPSTFGASPTVAKPIRNQQPTMSAIQRITGNQPQAKQATAVRSGVVTTPNRATVTAGLPMRQASINTATRTPVNGSEGVVRRIVIGPGAGSAVAGRPSGNFAANSTNVVQQQQQQRVGMVRATGAGGPIVTTTAGTMSGTSGGATTSAHKVIINPQQQQQQQMQQQQRKRKAASDQLPSVSITEIKKARMVGATVPRQQVNAGKNEITIVPRPSPAPVVRRGPKPKPKPSTIEIVQLD